MKFLHQAGLQWDSYNHADKYLHFHLVISLFSCSYQNKLQESQEWLQTRWTTLVALMTGYCLFQCHILNAIFLYRQKGKKHILRIMQEKSLCTWTNLNEQFRSKLIQSKLNKDQKPTNNDHLITVIMQMAYFYTTVNPAKTAALEVTHTFSYQCTVLSHI